MEKDWVVAHADETRVANLQEALGIHPILCKLLVLRGIRDFGEARKFFRPALEDLHSPWLMKGMEEAVDRILQAIRDRLPILVYGDYDVDGTTAVALLLHFLKPLIPNLDFYIPHRQKEGYGLSRAGVDYAIQGGFGLIICLDCGIRAHEMAAMARMAGIDLIICDHHLPEDLLPVSLAILNPKQPGCPYPFKELTGCGITFKLVSALAEKLGISANPMVPGMDLVAASIAADVVPVTGENRVMAYYGLDQINRNPSPAFRALIRVIGINSGVRMESLGYLIAPRINAAGRMAEARKAVELFTENNEEAALEIAGALHLNNTERRDTDLQMTREALRMIGDQPGKFRMTTVVYHPQWHRGVLGIVASRLTETYYRPTIVLTRAGDLLTGSARSISGFNIHEAIQACSPLLEQFGGHAFAAGVTLRAENLEPFRELFDETVARMMDPALLVPRIAIDAQIRIADIDASFFRILKQFEPCGPCNEHPVFLLRGVTDTGISRILRDSHIRFSVRQAGSEGLEGIGFGLAPKFPLVASGAPFDLVCRLEENSWNGHTSLRMKVTDIRAPTGG